MALSDAERTYWKQQADAGVKPDAIAAAIKAQRAAGGDTPPARAPAVKPDAYIPPGGRRRGDELFQPDPSPAGAIDTRGDKVAAGGLSGLVRGDRHAPDAPAGDGLKRTPDGLVGPDPNQFGTPAEQDQQFPILPALRETVRHPVDTLTDPSKRRELERGVSNAATFGLAQKIGEAVDPKFAAAAAPDAAAAPGYQSAGELGGMFLPNVGGKALEGLARGVMAHAPERVGARILSNVASGEAGGAAKGKNWRNLLAKAGPDGQTAIDEIEKAGLTKPLATQAAAHPAKALAEVNKALEANEKTALGPVYSAIDKAGTGPDTTQIGNELLDRANAARAKGQPEVAQAIERYVKHLDTNYAQDQVLSGSMIRQLKGGIGAAAFDDVAKEATPVGVAAKREIYGVYSKAVEDAAARTPGADVEALKAGNKRASTLLDVQANLADRAAGAARGRTGFATGVASGAFHGGVALELGHALVSGSPSRAAAVLAGYGGLALVKKLPQAIRYVDLAASQAEKARRAGQLAAEFASRIAGGAGRAASLGTAAVANSRDDEEGDPE
jgi:hypothetical protein